jgi:hypothetical protein
MKKKKQQQKFEFQIANNSKDSDKNGVTVP